ncbi:MAG: shikimate kinase, partial [Burkholderiaceae bacterium]
AWVVYLRSSPAELAKRLRFDTVRPLLQGGNAAKRLQDLFDQRDDFYKETAHFTVDTGRPSVHMLVNTIAMQFEMRGLTQLSGGVSPLP